MDRHGSQSRVYKIHPAPGLPIERKRGYHIGMAVLNFKGKAFVQNHHLSVKYHQLVPRKDKSLTDKVSLHDNLIIHGDNLLALKALLPTYAGKVKCIYIDPPYNLGNENWIYNDKVSNPMMQEWIGKVVDQEDLTRHDKWLCMMMPRLKMLRELLRENGVIFISIDDVEIHHLRTLIDEVFGEENFIDTLIWKKRYGGGAKEKYLVSLHEYIIAYAKDLSKLEPIYVPLNPEAIEQYYRLKDDKFDVRGPYRTHPLEATKSMGERKNLVYSIPAPDGTLIHPRRQWLWAKERTLKALADGELAFIRDKNGNWAVHTKQYLRDADGTTREKKVFSIIDDIFTQHGTNEIISIFSDAQVFPFAKPSDLIRNLVRIGTRPDNEDLILDSFSGSGTTAHAVLAQNKEDGGNRRFILVECEDYADKITAERVRRVIKGVKGAKDEALREGLGGTFSYFELGKPIEMESILSGNNLPSYEELARYVFYTATGEEFIEKKIDEKRFFVGESKQFEVFLFYKPDLDFLKSTALTLDRAKALGKYKGKTRLVFAPTKYMDQEMLDEYRIAFAQLPFEIYKLAE
jgi:adenine-specific DNA-methyltransferase